MEKKTVRLTVRDFSGQGEQPLSRNIVVTDGETLPASFTYNQPNMLDGVAFCVCVAGSARLRINSRVCDVTPGTVVTILPNHIVEPLERTGDLRLRMLVFSLDMVYDLHLQIDAVKAAGSNPCIRVSDEEMGVLLSMHDLVMALCLREDDAHNRAVLRSMFATLILQLEALYGRAARIETGSYISRAEELTEHFMKMLVQHYKSERSPSFYADKLCVTTKYLSQTVRQATGETVYAWINKIVMVGAKNMLRTTDMSVLQVSEELNFPNPSFFGRFFKRHAGITPLEYKKGD